jgi:hypothetical protein
MLLSIKVVFGNADLIFEVQGCDQPGSMSTACYSRAEVF